MSHSLIGCCWFRFLDLSRFVTTPLSLSSAEDTKAIFPQFSIFSHFRIAKKETNIRTTAVSLSSDLVSFFFCWHFFFSIPPEIDIIVIFGHFFSLFFCLTSSSLHFRSFLSMCIVSWIYFNFCHAKSSPNVNVLWNGEEKKRAEHTLTLFTSRHHVEAAAAALVRLRARSPIHRKNIYTHTRKGNNSRLYDVNMAERRAATNEIEQSSEESKSLSSSSSSWASICVCEKAEKHFHNIFWWTSSKK